MEQNQVSEETVVDVYEIIPSRLLGVEVYHTDRRAYELVELYLLCKRLAITKKPFDITSKTSFPFLFEKLEENYLAKKYRAGFEPILFELIKSKEDLSKPVDLEDVLSRKKPPVKLSEKRKKEISVFEKEYFKDPPKSSAKFTDEREKESENEKNVSAAEKRQMFDELFEKAKMLAAYDYGMYNVYSALEQLVYTEETGYTEGYDKDDFKLCFAFALRQTRKGEVRDFLKYRAKKDFPGVEHWFKDFLKDVIEQYNEGDFFPSYLVKPINDYLKEDFMKETEEVNSVLESETIDETTSATFSQVILLFEMLFDAIPNHKRSEVNNTDFARLIHFVMQKPITQSVPVNKSGIYQALSKPLNDKTQKKYLEEILSYIKPLKLQSVEDAISKKINALSL